MKRALLILSLLVLSPAAFANGCGGSLIAKKPVHYSGTQVGSLLVYYNNDNGNMCAVMAHGGPSWGVRAHTSVKLQRVRWNSSLQAWQAGTGSADYAADSDYYLYQAGPVRVLGRGHCAYAASNMLWRGTYVGEGTRVFCF